MSSTDLSVLVDAAWQAAMAAEPLTATILGVREFDGALADISPDGLAATDRRLRDLREATRALPRADLDPEERTTRSALIAFLDTQLAEELPRHAPWSVDQMAGPQVQLPGVADYQPLGDPDRAPAALRRWAAMGPHVDRYAANLVAELAEGRVAAAVLVRRVLDQLDGLLALPADEVAPVRPGWSGPQAEAVAAELAGQVASGLLPALRRLRTVLAEQILQAARPDERAGLSHLDGGEELYRQAVLGFTTTDLTAADVHDIGLAAIERTDAELARLGRAALGTSDLAATLDVLRQGAGAAFAEGAEILATARSGLAAAEAVAGDWFGLRHDSPCEIRPVPAAEQQTAPFGSYRWPSPDGSRPGVYFVNTYQPATQSRIDVLPNVFHEAVPGHHLQLSVAQHLEGLPPFRRLMPVPAYTEGWGLYAEHLADEMGLYDSDLDRLGALSKDALRSARLVVDTGLHALGWTRGQAVAYLVAHTAFGEPAAAREVDRYLAWPGQALAYKLGQLEILELRAQAQERLGNRFDVRRFHDAILERGALPLTTLRETVTSALP